MARETYCPCSGDTLDRFLRPTAMAVLAGESEGLHGYLIAQRLQELTIFQKAPPDPTGLYRTLKAMEQEGYLEATWDTENSGPAKRVYFLTENGRNCLKRWAQTLEGYHRALEETLHFVKQQAHPKGDES